MADPAINTLAENAFLVVTIVVVLGALSQVAMSYLSQRSLTDIHSQGLQAVVASNDIQMVDNEMSDGSNDNNGN